jgi:hypothetical protein
MVVVFAASSLSDHKTMINDMRNDATMEVVILVHPLIDSSSWWWIIVLI